MIDMIWHLRGSVSVDSSVSASEAIARIERLLEKQRKNVTEKREGAIAFYTPLWSALFGPNWLAMIIYDRGRFWAEDSTSGQKIRFDLRSFQGFVYCLSIAGFLFLVTIFGNGLLVATGVSALAFSWLYGMNMLLAWVRVPHAIRKAVRQP